MSAPALELSNIELSIAGKKLCANLDARLENNQSWALLGRNGSGKTSLLHAILGVREIQGGSITIAGDELHSIKRQELATRVGILFQDGISTLPATVMETALLGRHPHVQSVLRDNPEDIALAQQALEKLELASLADRQVDTLSGGERQRLALAMLITQAPLLYLLDEPSNHLDVAFQVKLLTLLKESVLQKHASLLMATHDINLAVRFCDHVILMMGDGSCLTGSCEEVLTEENLSIAYDCPINSIKEGDVALYYPG